MLSTLKAEPFVWKVAVRREVLDDAVAELRALTHEQARAVVDKGRSRRVIGRDNKTYKLRISIGRPQTGRALVTVRLSGGGLWKPRLTERFELACADAA